MAKVVLSDIASGFASIATLNANNTAIKNAMENTLSRDGTGPNYMTSDLDLNGNRILNQGNPITVEGFNWEGPWVTATDYVVGDVVENNNSSYIAIADHTSGTFATDLAANKWQVVASSASLPSQSGQTGKVLSTDGSNASWVDAGTVALSLNGGTLTGGLNGTTIATSGEVTVGSDLTVNGIIIPDGTKGIKGSTGGLSAAAGSVGEHAVVTIAQGNAIGVSSGVPINIASLVLTAGDYDVYGNILFIPAVSTNITVLSSSLNTTSATLDPTGLFSHRVPSGMVPGANVMGYMVPPLRVLVTSTTTVYLVASAVFTISTLAAFGKLQVRRRR